MKKLISSFLPSETNKFQNLLFLVCSILFFTYCFSIPTFSSRYPFNYLSIAICAVMCVGMMVYAILYHKIRINLMMWILVLFNIVMLISHTLNTNFSDFPKTIILMSLVAFCLYQFLSSYKRNDLFVLSILFAGLAFSIIYIIHYRSDLFNFSNIFDQRLGTYFDNENEISKEFGFFAAISTGLLLKNKKIFIKVFASISILMFLFLILSTGSISNLMTTIFVCILAIIICQKNAKNRIIVSAVVASMVILFVILLQLPFMSYFKTRIENIFFTIFNHGSQGYDSSAYSRLEAAITSIKTGLNKILFGFGYMSATEFTSANIQAHNNFAELFIDFGIFGLVLYEILVIAPLYKGFSSKNKTYILSITLYMLLFQLFLTTYYKKFEYIFFAYLFAILDDSFRFNYVLWDSSKLKTKKDKKIIFEVIPSLTPVGGAETFVTSFVQSLHARYDENIVVKVVILYKQKDSKLLEILKNENIEIFELDKKKGFDINCTFKFRELVYKYNPDVIHTHLFSISTLKLALPIKRKKIKCFHTIHHNVSKDNHSQRLLKRLVNKDYLIPICVAKKPADEYEKYFGRKVEFINNGVNLKEFDNSSPLNERTIDFLCVGRFVQIKNQSYLINLFKECKELSKYNLTFLGDGPTFEDCKNNALQSKLESLINFEGSVENVNEYMAKAKVLVMPSYNEGNPMVINEAFASGMVVIGNNVGGIVDLLKDVEFGGATSINNHKAFSQKMIDIMESIDSKAIVSANYDLSKIDLDNTVDKYLEVFGVLS